jgi:ribosomal protein L25 (general stress protein Ctc)
MSTDRVVLEVKERTATQFGSRNVRRLRREGLIPGVLYGKGAARSFVVGERDLRNALTGPSGMHAIVNVVIEGQETAPSRTSTFTRSGSTVPSRQPSRSC